MQATVWTDEMRTELRRAFRRGKYGAARAAFPGMTRGQVQAAIRRFVFDFDTANAAITEVITPAQARERLATFNREAFLEGVARLLGNGPRPSDNRSVAEPAGCLSTSARAPAPHPLVGGSRPGVPGRDYPT